jgi:phage baseplate assembly protein gpV
VKGDLTIQEGYLLGTAVVGSDQLADGLVTTAKLTNGAVTAEKLNVANGTLSGPLTINGGLTLQNGSLQGSGIVGSDQLADGLVTTAKLANGAVTADKLNVANGTLTGPLTISGNLTIQNGSLQGSRIVGTDQLADGAVTTAKLASSPLTISSDLTVSQTLTVTGQTTLSGFVAINTHPYEKQHFVITPTQDNIPFNVTDPTNNANWLTVWKDGKVFMNGGNIGIGTTNPNKGKLHVQGGDIYCSGRVYAEGGLVYWWGPDNRWKRIENRANDYAGSYTDNGPSDIRFKKDLGPIHNALEKVIQLQGIRYRWGETGLKYFTRHIASQVSAGPDASEEENLQLWDAERQKAYEALSGENIGLIAQDVEAIVPEVVHEDEGGYKHIRYQHLTALLIEAIKEQNAVIQALTDKVATLEAL